jgi:hypothetical protein
MRPNRAGRNNNEEEKRDETRNTIQDAHSNCRITAALVVLVVLLHRSAISGNSGLHNPVVRRVYRPQGICCFAGVRHGKYRGEREVILNATTISLRAIQ